MVRRPWVRPAATAWLGGVLLLGLLAPLLPLPFLPGVPDLNAIARPPLSGAHWLGTDAQGLDMLTQLAYGARTAVLLTLPAAALAGLLGALLGGVAGYWGNTGRVPLDALIVALANGLDTVPRLVLVVALAATGGFSPPGLLLLLALTSWSHPARLVRAQMLRVRQLSFIEAARASGLPAWRILGRHALPHAVEPLRAALPLSLAGLLGLESTLSFLGIGLAPDVASWGRLLASIRNTPEAWWVALFPLLLLTLSTLSLQTLSQRPSAHQT